jgi:hypothetical protein
MTPVDFLAGSNFELAFLSLQVSIVSVESSIASLTTKIDALNANIASLSTFVVVGVSLLLIVGIFTLIKGR